jgi:hypothetical protein
MSGKRGDRDDFPSRSLMRAADHDRQQIVDRLKAALDEGRLSLAEYDDRVRLVYEARTYADLHGLTTDLPRSTAELADEQARKQRALPMALLVLWTIWGSISALCVAIWLLTEVTMGGMYPWPIWVAVPLGAPLLAVTIGVQSIRRHRGGA